MRILKILAAVIILVACGNTNNTSDISSIDDLGGVVIEVDIPKEINISDALQGAVFYTSYFDTISLRNQDRRYVHLYLKTLYKSNPESDDMKMVKMDTFVRIYGRKIPIFNVKLKKAGEYHLEGKIEDLYYEYLKDDPENEYKIHGIDALIKHKISIVE